MVIFDNFLSGKIVFPLSVIYKHISFYDITFRKIRLKCYNPFHLGLDTVSLYPFYFSIWS